MPTDDKKTDTTGYKTYIFNSTPSMWYPMGLPLPELDLASVPKSESQEPIIGYRVWHLRDGVLNSCTQLGVWIPRRKFIRKDGTPGVNAMKSRQDIYETSPDQHPVTWMYGGKGLWSDYSGHVAGEVSLWGEVREHKFGYEAEFAYPRRLWVPESMDPVVMMGLEKNYGVPVEYRPELKPHPPKEGWDSLFKAILTSSFAAYPPLPAPPRKAGRQYFRYDATQNKVVPDTGPRQSYPLSGLDAGKFIKPMTDEEKKRLDKKDEKA